MLPLRDREEVRRWLAEGSGNYGCSCPSIPCDSSLPELGMSLSIISGSVRQWTQMS